MERNKKQQKGKMRCFVRQIYGEDEDEKMYNATIAVVCEHVRGWWKLLAL